MTQSDRKTQTIPLQGGSAPLVRVLGQYIKDLSFENPSAPNIGKNETKGNIEMSIDVRAEKQSKPANATEVTLKILAHAKTGESTLFLLELDYAGIFELINLPPEEAEAVLMIEAPRQLFPFARRLIVDLTREGGFPPLLIGPIDFADLYRTHINKNNPDQRSFPTAH